MNSWGRDMFSASVKTDSEKSQGNNISVAYKLHEYFIDSNKKPGLKKPYIRHSFLFYK